MNKVSIKIQEQRDKWKSRRLMTWIIFWSMISSYFYALFYIDPSKLELYISLYTTFFTFGTAVLAAYFGFSTYHDVKTEKPEPTGKAIDETEAS